MYGIYFPKYTDILVLIQIKSYLADSLLVISIELIVDFIVLEIRYAVGKPKRN